ncbi:cilia- and flagella-associated protein 107 [Sorex araneus]|uniref:cilia- and flagella-associated protein 107 n=1 Tax=Sorex araneus TaxID=42254 RepID=UPI0003316F24|nr:cilia- and flagella-associated protein 107 [Sorex araneus]
MQFVTAGSPQSFSTPSWKVESQYSTRVLTGNWVEEREKFTKASEKTPQCTYRSDFIHFPGHRPDQVSRWYGKRKNEGLPYKHVMEQRQGPPHGHLISSYDDHYNRHNYNPGQPLCRVWNRHTNTWVPERSDRPLLAPPTNYGLYERLRQCWLAPEEHPRRSVYAMSYRAPPLSALSWGKHAVPLLSPRFKPPQHVV